MRTSTFFQTKMASDWMKNDGDFNYRIKCKNKGNATMEEMLKMKSEKELTR